MYRRNRRSRDTWNVPECFCLKIGQTCLGPGPFLGFLLLFIHFLFSSAMANFTLIFDVCVQSGLTYYQQFYVVLHISGEIEFTKFCLYPVFHFIALLLTSTKFSLHKFFFEIINVMLLLSINISHNFLILTNKTICNSTPKYTTKHVYIIVLCVCARPRACARVRACVSVCP